MQKTCIIIYFPYNSILLSYRRPMRRNYLNNKDLLAEIHKSKTSYCSFKKPEDADYDIILKKQSQINPSNIRKAKKNRIEKLMKKQYELTKDKSKVKQIRPREVRDQDLIFRVMTWEHIPEDLPKPIEIEEEVDENAEVDPKILQKLKIAEKKKYVKVNFPPFQHFKVDKNGKARCVGKSHWIGDLKTGHYSRDHGQMTNKLAHMFLKLCERYGTRGNWRGYCVDSETEALTQRGWLKESDMATSDKILSFDGEHMVWSDIHSIFRDHYNGKMFKMASRGIDALITPGHKIVVDDGLVKIEHLKESDRIILMGNSIKDQNPVHQDSLVELIGWIVTEGNYQPNKKQITIYQNEGIYADRIRNALSDLGFEFAEKKSSKSDNIAFSIKRKHWNKITELIPTKNLTMNFILSLSNNQKNLLIETMINADGHRHGALKRYTQKNKIHMDLFQALLALTGQKMNVHYVENKMSFGKPVNYYIGNIFSRRGNKTRGESVNLHGGKNNGRARPGLGKVTHPNFPTIDYNGIVWCPKTDYGCFLARRNGKPYLTGNTYNDEMRNQALLQLVQIGLQFDESKSANPFAYYTAVISNSFTRVLNIEKKNQNIRDDILEMNNLSPSYTRQNAWGGGGGGGGDYDHE